MAINIPTSVDTLIKQAESDIKSELKSTNPFLRVSWIRSLMVSLVNRAFDFFVALKILQTEVLPDTAVENLPRWANIFKIPTIAASRAVGEVTFTGVLNSNILRPLSLFSSDQKTFDILNDGQIVAQSLTISSLVRVGQTAIATFNSPHKLTDQVIIFISGADQPEYNVSNVTVEVVDEVTIQYPIEGTPISPATGVITLTGSWATLSVASRDPGEDQNLPGGEELTLSSPISGVLPTAKLTTEGTQGGTDTSGTVDIRERLLDRLRNPVAHFNEADIRSRLQMVPGITREWIQRVTPSVGQVTIYFVRDNDDNIIPDLNRIAEAREMIRPIVPANTKITGDPGGGTDVFILAPDPVTVDVTITNLVPDTPQMRTAVADSVEQFFTEKADLGKDIAKDAVAAAVFQTVDLTTGTLIENATVALTAFGGPLDLVPIASGQIAAPGNVEVV